MNIWTKSLAGATMAVTLSFTSGMAIAETPANMLVIANRIDDIKSMDPAQSFEFAGSDVNQNVYSKLVNFDPLDYDKGYVPDLAESWVVSEDGMSITFTMRDGVMFQSGNPVTADDAAWSLRRAVILNKTPAFILTQFGFTPENVNETITVDGNTLTIKTDKRYATSFLLNCLTATIGSVVDMKTAMANEVDGDMGNAWLNTNTAGSGAYSLVSWKPNDSVTLQAFPGYYGGAPAMERVIVRHVAESASQRLLLEAGDIDVARNLNPEDVAGARNASGIKIHEELKGRLMYMGLNQTHPILSKPEVRQAFKYLIDYEGMQNSFLNGQWATHQNFLPKTYLGASTENPFSLNIEKAKELLAAAGVENLEVEIGVREAQERIEMAQSFQNTAAQAGVKVNITVGTGSQILDRYRARELDLSLESWGPDYPDPQTNAGTFAYNPDNSFEAQGTGYLAWRLAWDTSEFNPMVEAAVQEVDTEKRIAMYNDIQAKFRDESPFVMMFQQSEQLGIRDNVMNFTTGQAISSADYSKVTK
ncbi:peptide/nickel transport system substrate-binding protein [Pseudorhodobacter antarcticus]|jgi:peptide/nickel transport system substrate-binding protein|uniref:Peptide/nickel transport system substrate-binding protein n=1 Tax=Pseudorhodobacter antarcticus TaxID=1077947 RepID=A0A1H8J2T6_9RHOB|nr:ABC transporter substrate-binding protein [Pseudorhodobacter antarcticus]SEN75250.1 peptide/nickel transport system substrate-binding protein [Pseudorhodobacter antarcticus]